jgi:putative peptidoglycan lipid II flippase
MSKGLLRPTLTVGFHTTLSRILGFIRDMVLARVFGATGATDAFFVAFRIPNLARRLFAEGAFSSAFVPVLSQVKETQTTDDVARLVRNTTGTLAAVLALVTAVGIVAAPVLIYLFAPGFADEPEKFDLTVALLRVCFPYLAFIALTALCGAVLNVYGRFAVPAFTPVLLNVVLIGAALGLAPLFEQPVMALAVGVLIGGAVQLLFQIPAMRALGMLHWPRWGRRDPGVRRIARLMLPALLGSSVAQINVLFGTLLASFLASGSVTWLYYADRLVEFPLGVFGIALATVILPKLSQQHAAQSGDEFSRTLNWALRITLVIALPASIGLAMLAGPILITLFTYGEFGVADAGMTALALSCYAIGLVGFVAVKILAPGFYARQDTRTPVRIGMIAIVANIVLSVSLAVPMHVLDIPGAHAGLALATSLSAFINAGLMFVHLRRHGIHQPLAGGGRLIAQLAVACGTMAALLGWITPPVETWVDWSTAMRAGQLVMIIVGACVVYFGALRVTGLKLHELLRGHGDDGAR